MLYLYGFFVLLLAGIVELSVLRVVVTFSVFMVGSFVGNTLGLVAGFVVS